MSKIIQAENLTALVLTWNEEENIGKVLQRLDWLEKIIIVDSGSTDNTLNIIKKFVNTEIYFRRFDSFAEQCNYGLSLIKTTWVLSLDADYILPPEFSDELKTLLSHVQPEIVAYACDFNFLVFGKALYSNNTTPRPVLFKKDYCTYYNDGHAHRLSVNGKTGKFKIKIDHDDRKPLSRWLANQDKYSIQESEKILSYSNDKLSFTSKLRKAKLFAPVFIFFHCLFVKGLIFSGWRGWHYTLQRTIAEMLISLRLTESQHLQFSEKENK